MDFTHCGELGVTVGGEPFVSNARNYVPVEGEIARTYRPLRQEV